MKRLMEVLFILPLIMATALMLAAVTYTGDYNGKTVMVNAGDTFTVKLDENPTTGYSWNLTADSGLQVDGGQYVPYSTGLMGSGGYHTWTIKAVKAGTYRINGIYKRPWESISGQEKTFTLTVQVIDTTSAPAAMKNIVFPSIKSLIGLKPEFARNLTSFSNVFGNLHFMGFR